VEDKVLKKYGSILNIYLTEDNWKDNSGWVIYKKIEKKLIITNKDFWLYSKNKSKIYELFSRGNSLTKVQSEKENKAQIYFSKSYEKFYIENFSHAKYDSLIKGIELKYPEIKQ
jgi:hypothetical protein